MPTVTTMKNVINPQVMGDMIEAKIDALAKLTPYAKVDTTLEGTAGDTKTVPSWKYIGDAEDFDVEEASKTDSEIKTTNLSATSNTFTIKCAAKSVGILQTVINSGLGNPIGQAETQLAKAIMGKVDNDLVDAGYTTKNIYNPVTLSAISYNGIVDADAIFEDEEDGIEKVLFIHPLQHSTLMKDEDFKSADKFGQSVLVKGAVGKIGDCWVKKSKKIKYIEYEKADEGTITIVEDRTSESTTAKHLKTVQKGCKDVLKIGDKVNALAEKDKYYLDLLLKMEPDSAETEYTEEELPALTIFLKKDTQVDHEWFPKKQKHDITATKYYGVAVTNEAKVLLAKFKK